MRIPSHTSKTYFQYVFIIALFLVCAVMFFVAHLIQNQFARVMGADLYLTWHSMFEFIAALISFCVFAVSYYAYEQTRNLRSIFLGAVFFIVGMIDVFHTLSFKGMPIFFVQNTGANRATTFWVVSRLIFAAGLLIATMVPPAQKTKINKKIFWICPIIIGISTLITVTYFPGVIPAMYVDGSGLTLTKKVLEFVIISFFILSIINLICEHRKTGDNLLITLIASLVFSIFCEIAFVFYIGVYDIYNYLGHVYKFVACFFIFKVIFIFNVRKPYMELSKARDELNEYAENLDKLVHERTLELKKANGELLQDLEYARDIQKALLPVSLPCENEVEFTVRYFPAQRVSGDFYHIFKLDEENIGLYIGDVSGHGVSAAMLTVFLKQSIKVFKDSGESYKEKMVPSDVLKELYKSFNDANFKEEVYIVMLYAIYNMKTRVINYSSAGMNVPPLFIRKGKGISEIPVKGFPICKFIEYYSGEYKDHEMKLFPGDKVLFYTDGITEAQNFNKDQFSEEKLKSILKENQNLSGVELAQEIENQVTRFSGESKLKDDITFFIMDIK